MKNELLAPAGSSLSLALTPLAALAHAAGFDWVVEPLRVSLSLVPVGQGGCCGGARHGLPAELVAVDACGLGSAPVELRARLNAPAAPGAYRAVFVVEGLDREDLRLELDAGTVLVTPSLLPRRRGTRLSEAPAPQP